MKKIILPLIFVSLFISSFILERNKLVDEIVSKPCAVFIMPTSEMIDSLQQADEDTYNIVLDDNMYYLGLTREYLDSLQISTLDTVAEGNLKFKTNKNEVFEFDLSQNAWQVILFNGKNKPIKLNITDSEIEIKKYLK